MIDEQKLKKNSENKQRSSSRPHRMHKKGANDPLRKKKKALKKLRKRSPRTNFSYQLFLYRQELKRASADFSYLRLSRAKIMLTNELIAKKIGSNEQMSSVDDLKMLSRELQFKKRLASQVERLEEFKNLGLTEMILDGKKTTL
ncbi:uncharacterized protein LOC117579792 [Drosophila guanche]|uniref:Uncharacterized protein n=1 Tax=Drosophila guanche TaxID=7266 RepID=A0A3B0JSW1_DROGU|nr:uncharacterized protein LOC117579792 [Drosophila guanche]SPP76446.1 Hypothetical predicted protein [Drosophila guanche]